MTDIVRLSDIRTIPDLNLNDNGQPQHTDSWLRIDLLDDEYRKPPEPPIIHGLLYAARRHVISGPPESTKTLVAYLLLLEALRQGHGVAIIDLEMGPHAAVTMLRELGATDDEIGQTLYFEPDQQPHDDLALNLSVAGVQFVLIDAAAGAYDVSGLNDNHRQEVEQFAVRWIRPLWRAGIATIVVDHVTKDSATRGKFTIGSERKTGQADVHLSLEALKPLHRGGSGIVKVNVHKDRPGHLPRPTVYLIALDSDENHRITWDLRDPSPTEQDGFRHTIYMERISRHMERNPAETYSKTDLEKQVEGKGKPIRDAVDELLADGHLTVVGKRGGYPTYALVTPYSQPSPSLRPSPSQVRPDDPGYKVVPPSQSLQGTGMRDVPTNPEDDPQVRPPEIDVYDEEVQSAFDGPVDW